MILGYFDGTVIVAVLFPFLRNESPGFWRPHYINPMRGRHHDGSHCEEG